jgi:hypothetical protein
LRDALTSKSSAERLSAAYVAGERQLFWTSDLIDRLTDSNTLVRQAARRSLVILSYFTLLKKESPDAAADQSPRPGAIVDFGPKTDADETAREEAVKQWKEWWDRNGSRNSSADAVLRSARAGSGLDAEAARLSAALVFAPTEKQKTLIASYREQKGVVYTEALANALAQLNGEMVATARAALAERLSRMTPLTLRDRLGDPRAELRRAAALARAMKDDRSAIPELIPLLADREDLVVRAVKAGLKSLTGQDFGPPRGASPAEQTAAVAAWKSWWKNHR